MKRTLTSRRVILGLAGIAGLLALGFWTHSAEHVAMPIALICGAVASANAYQGKGMPSE